jgi:hypothetical protein
MDLWKVKISGTGHRDKAQDIAAIPTGCQAGLRAFALDRHNALTTCSLRKCRANREPGRPVLPYSCQSIKVADMIIIES